MASGQGGSEGGAEPNTPGPESAPLKKESSSPRKTEEGKAAEESKEEGLDEAVVHPVPELGGRRQHSSGSPLKGLEGLETPSHKKQDSSSSQPRLDGERIGFSQFAEFCQSLLSDRLSPTEIKTIFSELSSGTFKASTNKRGLRAKESSHPDFMVPDTFDYNLPTTDPRNYGVPIPLEGQPDFHGLLKKFRAGMDYTYHKMNFTKERQHWQDKFVERFLGTQEPQKEPWLVLNCGADNATTMDWMTKNCISLENLVYVSKSDFKLRMPEWAGYVMNVGVVKARENTHDEAKYCQELLQESAMNRSRHIFVECKLRDTQFFIDMFSDIRRRHPKYKIAIFYVMMSEADTQQQDHDAFRVKQRLTEASLGRLMSHVDFCAHVQWQPQLLAFATIDRTGRWELIASRFSKSEKSKEVVKTGIRTAQLEQIFKEVAVPHKGVLRLGFQQFFDVCTVKIGIPLNETELKRIFDVIDEGHTGALELRPFIRAVQRSTFLRNVVSAYNQKRVVFEVPANYNYNKSTCHAYANPDLTQFTGPYADIRKERDYNYHVNFTKARQDWQDSFIDGIVSRTEGQPNPWVVFTCGPMGAGKGYALSWMSKQGYFPLENIVHIDPDYFKSVMPEWEAYTKLDDVTAGGKCHQESCYIQEIAQEVSLRRRQNLWVDGSLRDADWFCKVFDDIRCRFPHYKIAIFYVYASEQVVRDRIAKRGKETGRVVPEALIQESLAAPDHSLSLLTQKVDFLARINNEQRQPILASFEFIDRTREWNNVVKQFDNKFTEKKKCDELDRKKQEDEFSLLEQNFRQCCEIKDRSYMFKQYRACFVGRNTVDTLVEKGIATSRAHAVELGNRLLNAGVFRHVVEKHAFKDEALFYRFTDSPGWSDFKRTGSSHDKSAMEIEMR